MDQIQLARALDVSRSAVNAWINDRAWPMNRIAALEDLLSIKIPRTLEEQQEASRVPVNGTGPPPPTDPTERELYDLAVVDAGEEGAWAVVEEYRRRRRRTA